MSDVALIALACVVGAYVLFVGGLILAGRRQEARAVGGFLPDCVVLVTRLLSDARTPRLTRWMLVLTGLYLASPIDLVPDFIPVAGQLDDAIILGLALRVVIGSTGPGLIRELWPGPASTLRALLRLAGSRPAGAG